MPCLLYYLCLWHDFLVCSVLRLGAVDLILDAHCANILVERRIMRRLAWNCPINSSGSDFVCFPSCTSRRPNLLPTALAINMCGIFCSASRHDHLHPSEPLAILLRARGPDSLDHVSLKTPDAFLTLHSTVLSLRGSAIVPQPYRTPESDAMLCWNGEAWCLRGQRPHVNDTPEVFTLLQAATRRSSFSPMNARAGLFQAVQNVSIAMAQVAGPYAFVFYDALNARIFFGRDFLGRRSLLWRITTGGDVVLSSVTDGVVAENWFEVEADGIYCLDLSTHSCNDDLFPDHSHRWGDFSVVKTSYTFHDGRNDTTDSVIPLLSLNREILFAYETINESSSSVSHLGHLLRRSLSLRVSNIPEPSSHEDGCQALGRAKVGILFSGGLDCTTLARLVHEMVHESEPIDLLNVAFENPRAHKDKEGSVYELCPDRITGLKSHAELSSVCAGREWRFVAVNVPYADTLAHRPQVIKLMHPHNSEMDLSIAYALYFAARGQGLLSTDNFSGHSRYTTSARVLLSGLGADELFAGYTRHATAFRRNGYEALLDELELDISRLGKRNLGRDDRVISHWSKEVRFPFLDEDLVKWALATPVTDKCDFASVALNWNRAVETGDCTIEPGKKVLRCLASKLGMKGVAREKKRAIQFGARTAKMETSKTKGTTLLC